VVTQELRTAVFVPREYKLVGVPEGFVILRTAYGSLERWFDNQQRTSALGSLPVQGHAFVYGNLGGAQTLAATWWATSSMAAGISIPIFAIGCELLWTPWSNRLSVVLVATFIVSLLSLSYADGVYESLLAARWGIGFGVAAWMLAAVVGFQESTGAASALGKMKEAIAGAVKGGSRRGKDSPDTLPAYESADKPSDESTDEPAAEDDSAEGSAEQGDTPDVYEVDGGADAGATDEADGGETDPDVSDESDESGQTESQP